MHTQLSLILKAWRLLKPFHRWFLLNTLIAFALSGISVGITVLGARILNHIPEENTRLIVTLFAALFACELLWNLINYFKDKISKSHLGQNVVQHLQEHSFRKILNLTVEQHIEDHSAIKQQIIARGETAIESVVNVFVSEFIPNISYLIIAIIALAFHNITLGTVTLVVCLILGVWVFRFTAYYRPFIQKNRDNWIEHAKTRTEAFTHLQLVKTLGRENYFVNKYIRERGTYAEHDIMISLIGIAHRSKRSIFVSSSDNVVFLIAIILTLKGGLSVSGVFLVWSIVGRIFWSIAGLTSALRDLPLRLIEAQKYFDAVDLTPSFKEHGVHDTNLRQAISFKDVSFKYRKSESPTLEKISFTIPEGKVTAFVGSSGSGKSTITKLLLRSYDYHEGSITIGDTELRTIDAHYLREHIGYVEQHVDLLDETIRENILLGVRESERVAATERLDKVAKLARIDQFYHRLGEHKFETIVGERGIKLSGGERQRVGIARAIIKDPEILIFDEATSSLDTENEKHVMDAIHDVSLGKTTIVIAHRLSTIKSADKIIVLDKGRIAGEGTHDELMRNCLHYKALVEHQLVA